MIALLEWVDGFGADTHVRGIFPTLNAAKPYIEEGNRYVEFDFGLVDFDFYEAKKLYPVKKKRK